MFAILYYTPAIDWRLVRSLAAALLCILCVATVFALMPTIMAALAFVAPTLLKMTGCVLIGTAYLMATKRW